MKWTKQCIFCHSNVYTLSENALKCRKCKKKYAKNKTNKTLLLLELFLENKSALEVAKLNGFSYASVHSYYDDFRKLCAMICEREYEHIRHKESEYEEYFYLEKSKRYKKEAVFDAKNFLTFDYDGHIYTILLPNLNKFKTQFIEDELTPTYLQEFKRFKRQTRLIKISSRHNNIVAFWEFFEKFILHYKGIKQEQFGLFLKECEFKFNHSKDEAFTLLQKEYFL